MKHYRRHDNLAGAGLGDFVGISVTPSQIGATISRRETPANDGVLFVGRRVRDMGADFHAPRYGHQIFQPRRGPRHCRNGTPRRVAIGLIAHDDADIADAPA